jgi:branched-chain amino acid transport system permease protein
VPFAGGIDFERPENYYYVAVGVVLIALLVLYYVERAYISFPWRAIKDDNTLAGAVGINVIGYKTVNFVLAAFMAGISGALFASFQHNLSPDTTSRFGVTMSIYLLVYMVVGGKNYFIGPLVGTTVLTLLAENTRSMQEYQPMITGAIAILVMIFMPMGIVGLPAQIRNWRRARRLKLAVAAARGPGTVVNGVPGAEPPIRAGDGSSEG